ncbi:hypothetical protein BKA66DRAFT_552303 [Pyrenochaeta sp. MPI-SDFR-AT-0127]|nr:hypothetical protein BKA66DRAFT_552303 [Pyrenochaeta sp. MPI-SDFR-AT-0127]
MSVGHQRMLFSPCAPLPEHQVSSPSAHQLVTLLTHGFSPVGCESRQPSCLLVTLYGPTRSSTQARVHAIASFNMRIISAQVVFVFVVCFTAAMAFALDRRRPQDLNAWNSIKVEVCLYPFFMGPCRLYHTVIDQCINLSTSYNGSQIGSVRSLTDMGNCWIYTTNSNCETQPGVISLKVYWGLGGIQDIRIPKRMIGSMECFIMGKPTELINYDD